MSWGQAWGTSWGAAWGDSLSPSLPSQDAWGSAWGASWGDSWGADAVSPTYTPASVTVRAFRVLFFGGVLREIGSTFDITTPYQFTPYGMVLVDTPPSDWLSLMESYSKSADNDRIRIPGRNENRIPVNGSLTVPVEAGNPYD